MSFKTIRYLKEAIEIVRTFKYPVWYKNFSTDTFQISLVGYKDHFLRLKLIKWKLKTIWSNLTNIFEEH